MNVRDESVAAGVVEVEALVRMEERRAVQEVGCGDSPRLRNRATNHGASDGGDHDGKGIGTAAPA